MEESDGGDTKTVGRGAFLAVGWRQMNRGIGRTIMCGNSEMLKQAISDWCNQRIDAAPG
jgi:hypothetical protein